MNQNPPLPHLIRSQTEALYALGGVNQSRFRRLARLGLLRQAAGGGFIPDELRRDYALASELEQRVAAIGGTRLTLAERNGAFAWLVEAARGASCSADQGIDLPTRVVELLERLMPSLGVPGLSAPARVPNGIKRV